MQTDLLHCAIMINLLKIYIILIYGKPNVRNSSSSAGAQLGGHEGGLSPLAQKWRSYKYSRFDEFFWEGVGGRGGNEPMIIVNDTS